MNQLLHSPDCEMTVPQFVAWLRAVADTIEKDVKHDGEAYELGEWLLCVYDTHTKDFCSCETPANHQERLTQRALDGANVCRVIKHVYIDGTCAQCGAREPSKSDDEEAYQMLLDEAPMYYPDNPPRK